MPIGWQESADFSIFYPLGSRKRDRILVKYCQLADIRAVRRPVNTIVDDSGRDGPKRYAVREHSGAKYVQGGNPQPRNDKVIGHIIDHVYVPLEEKTAPIAPDMLSYGASALVKSVTSDLLHDLLAVYPAGEVYSIISMATLKVIKPSITAMRMSTHYNRTFVCRDYPGAALSKNTICSLLQRIGQDSSRRKMFYQRRLAQVAKDHHIAIDGTLKQDTSRVNDLSDFSYKARVKGCCDVSVLYAYDIELMEPVCAEVFPGNRIDAGSYPAFIRDNDIRKGIIVADKGFPPSKIKEELKERPKLHFLTPIKRNDSRISENDMLSFEGVLTGIDDHVLFKKKQLKGGRYLYSFKDIRKASIEESDYLARAKASRTFDTKNTNRSIPCSACSSWNRTRTLILKLHISVTMTAGSWNLSLTAIKTMNALIRQTYRGIFPSWGMSL